jgi:hypothetical protein
MLERIQAKAARHNYPDTLPLRYLLNQGVRLPDDLPALRALVDQDEAVFVVFDSVYNFLSPAVGLKEEGVAGVLAETKRQLCDQTGCTVAFVDHAPWPTEGNRGQRRAYGSVFKTAAVRWTIHLESDGKDDTRLHAEASGNNVAGFRRTPATWDEDTLEIRLLDIKIVDEEALEAEVAAYVEQHPGTATSTIAKELGKRRENVENALERLQDPGRVNPVHFKSSRDLGRPGTGRYWFPHNHAPSEASQLFGTGQDDSGPHSSGGGDPSQPSAPRRGDGSLSESVTTAAPAHTPPGRKGAREVVSR